MTAAALILAAALSSPQIGNFVALSNSCPTVASSRDTPGSDPADGSGWYVTSEVYTNWTEYGEWTVESASLTNPNLVIEPNPFAIPAAQQPTNIPPLDLAWDVRGVAEVAKPLIVSTNANVRIVTRMTDRRTLSRPSSATNLFFSSVVMDVQARASATNDWYNAPRARCHLRLARTATACSNLVGSVTAPRAARLTPGVHAGVSSAYEAMFERTYYILEGQTNAWDASSQYGPNRYALNEFWFDPRHPEHRYDYIYEYAGAYSEATNAHGLVDRRCEWVSNRVDATRRLIDCPRLDALAGYLYGTWRPTAFAPVGYARPGWIKSSDVAGSKTPLWLSSTAAMFSTNMAPAALVGVWCENPTIYSNDWQACCLALQDLGSGPVWNYTRNSGPRLPWSKVIEDLDFGLPDYSNAVISCRRMTNETFDAVLTNVYPHADPAGILTNSHRLVSHRIAAVNQTLGVIDRTYAEPSVTYPSVASNTIYQHWHSAIGDLAVQLVYDASVSASPFLDVAPADICWGSVSDEYPAETLGCTNGVVSSLAWRVSPTETWSSSAVQAEVNQPKVQDYELSAMVSYALPSAVFDGDFDIYIMQGGVLPNSSWSGNGATVHVYCSGGGLSADCDVVLSIASIYEAVPTTVKCIYGRRYSYERNYGDLYPATDRRDRVTLGASQPGRTGFARTAQATAAILAGLHAQTNAARSAISGSLVYSANLASRTRYKATVADYASRKALENLANAATDELYERFKSELSINPVDSVARLPIESTDFVRVCDSTGGRVFASLAIPSNFHFRVTFESGTVTGYYIVTDSSGSETLTPFPSEGYSVIAATVGGPLTNLPPRAVELPAKNADARLGVMTRVDWNWNALKRTDD